MASGAAVKLRAVQLPLSLHPVGSVPVADGIALLEDDSGNGSVFVWGQVVSTWDATDPTARRLCAVQLVNADAASQRAVAAAFGVNETTVWRWRSEYGAGGTAALLAKIHGPKGPSKLTDEKRSEIKKLRSENMTLLQVAKAASVSTDTVRRAIAVEDVPVAAVELDNGLVPLNPPVSRDADRQAARRGLLNEAAPVITQGASLPLAGALVILPALLVTGLLDVATSVYGKGRHVAGAVRPAFYGLRSLVLCVVFSCLVNEPRAEGLTRIDPQAIGRLLGLDRAPEANRLRLRMAELADEHKADELVMGLARRHIDAHPDAVGLLYIDGHVRAYHGKEEIPKAHVARMRIAMPAEVDTWVSDRFGDGLLVWQSAPGASLVGELRIVTDKVRQLLGEDARPTICFDRGGWSPKLFAELDGAGFDILTYRKGVSQREPRSAFRSVSFTDGEGRTHDYLLAERPVRIGYDNAKKRFGCRQITRLDELTGHQTQIVTTRNDPDAGLVAHAMFSRWRQENFFRYQRAHFGLDALDAYETTADDPARMVANPRRRDADRVLKDATSSLDRAEAREGKSSLDGEKPDAELRQAFADARAEVERLAAAAKAIPAKVQLAEVRPAAVRIDVERKRIMDAIRMATYNAESALARMIAPHYARADDEARTLLREIFSAPGDIEIDGDCLHVRINALAAPRRTRALIGLCAELTATETLYPGTSLTLVYSVKER
ncbi:MAG: putative transposase [Acidiferrobacteraceae bacterium]